MAMGAVETTQEIAFTGPIGSFSKISALVLCCQAIPKTRSAFR